MFLRYAGSLSTFLLTSRLDKHFPVVRQQILNNSVAGLKNRRAVFSV
jgi:hypothetical protein